MLKKLTAISLTLLLVVGLSAAALATNNTGTETVDANIDSYIGLTAPNPINSWSLTADGGNPDADSTNNSQNLDVNVISNVPYQLEIHCDSPSEGTAGKMNEYTSSDYTSSPAVTLTEAFYFKHDSSDGSTTSPENSYTKITTSDQTVTYIEDAATDNDGYVTTVKYAQPVKYSDQRLLSHTYHIEITYTATNDLT